MIAENADADAFGDEVGEDGAEVVLVEETELVDALRRLTLNNSVPLQHAGHRTIQDCPPGLEVVREDRGVALRAAPDWIWGAADMDATAVVSSEAFRQRVQSLDGRRHFCGGRDRPLGRAGLRAGNIPRRGSAAAHSYGSFCRQRQERPARYRLRPLC